MVWTKGIINQIQNDDSLNTCNSFQSIQGHKKVNFEDYKIFEVRIVRQTVMFQQMKTGR
jgi:hypothetical protein